MVGRCGSRISKTLKLIGYGDNKEGRSKDDFKAITGVTTRQGDSPCGRKALDKITVCSVIK